MPNIDLYTLLEANSNLAREKKELMRLVHILSQTVKEISTAAELYGEGMSIEASRYRAMPKGFMTALLQNRMMVEKMTKQSKISAENVDHTMREMAGGYDDHLSAEAYYQSLLDELMQHKMQKDQDASWWMSGYRDKDGKWHFKSPENPKAKEFYEKYKKDIDSMMQDYMKNLFNIDPKNFGGDIEGEWQDGINPEREGED